MTDMDERKLVAEICAGSREAFERLLDIHESRVYGVCRGMVGEQEAEDAAQDALIEVYRSIGGFRGQSSLATWIYRITVNVCLQRRRKSTPDTVPIDEAERHPDPTANPGQSAESGETRDRINSALAALPEIHRDVIVLHELHGLTYHECASALGCPVGTVKSRLSNAFRRLRELLQDYAPESGVAI